MEARTVSATHFKAHCLALMDEVARTGRPLLVTKYNREVVRVVPAEPLPSLRGSGRQLVSDEELLAPIDAAWEAAR